MESLKGKGLFIQATSIDRPIVSIQAPGGSWDLSGYKAVYLELSNPGTSEVRVSGYLNDHQWNEGMAILSPGE